MLTCVREYHEYQSLDGTLGMAAGSGGRIQRERERPRIPMLL